MKKTGILGQKRILEMLEQELSAGNVSHAYLFYGPAGCGKKTLATHLAAALNCAGFPHGPCHECPSCRRVFAGIHPDFHKVEPEGKTVKIDQVREVIKRASFRPHEGRYQVFMLDLGEGLTPEAANSMLKVLEEPPERTVFILVATNLLSLPPTVVSRCRLYRPDRLEKGDLAALVQDAYGVSAEQADLAVRLSEGLPGRALHVVSARQQEAVEMAAGLLIKRPYLNSIAKTAGDLAERQNLEEVVDAAVTLLRDQLIYNELGDTPLLYFPEPLENAAREDIYWTTSRITTALSALLELQQTLKTPVNTRLAMEKALRRIKEAN